MANEKDEVLDQETHTQGLEDTFLKALKERRAGRIDKAMDLLRKVIHGDPRLPEPHLELAHVHLEAERFDLAEVEAREGLRWLEQGGQWVEDLPMNVVLSHAHDLLGQILQDKAATDEIVFGDEEVFTGMLREATGHFETARELDPKNDHANYNSFFLQLGDTPEA